MSEFKNIMREYDRMCNGMSFCGDCPIASSNNGNDVSCNDLMRKFPEKAERIILQWSKENPIMTNGKKFEEVFGFSPYMKFRSFEDMRRWIEAEYVDKKKED